jgi:hypothetical protein
LEDVRCSSEPLVITDRRRSPRRGCRTKDHLRQHQRALRLRAGCQQDQRRGHRHDPAERERKFGLGEALHDHLAGILPTVEEARPETSTASANVSAAAPPIVTRKALGSPASVSTWVRPAAKKEAAAATSISTLTSPAGDGGEHVGTLEPKHTPTLPSVAGCLVLRHRRVEIDRCWHDRGAEDGQIAWAHVDQSTNGWEFWWLQQRRSRPSHVQRSRRRPRQRMTRG